MTCGTNHRGDMVNLHIEIDTIVTGLMGSEGKGVGNIGVCVAEVGDIRRVTYDAQTRVVTHDGSDNLTHIDTVGAELVAPSKGGIGPVDGKDNFIVAFPHPVEDVAGGNLGVHRLLRISREVEPVSGLGAIGDWIHRQPVDEIAISSHVGSGIFGRLACTVGGLPVVEPPAGKTGKVKGNLIIDIREIVDDSVDRGAMLKCEVVVVSGDGVHQVGNRDIAAVPLHAPHDGNIAGSGVVPSDGDNGTVGASASPETDAILRDNRVGGLCHDTKSHNKTHCKCKYFFYHN